MSSFVKSHTSARVLSSCARVLLLVLQLGEIESEDEEVRERVEQLYKMCESYRDAVRGETAATQRMIQSVNTLFGDGGSSALGSPAATGGIRSSLSSPTRGVNGESSGNASPGGGGGGGGRSIGNFIGRNNNARASPMPNASWSSSDMLKPKVGGPVLSRFMDALDDLSEFREALEQQIDLQLCERLKGWATTDLADVREARKRFNKAGTEYEAATKRYLARAGKSADDSAAQANLATLKASYEQSRVALISTLDRVEGQKKFILMEAVVLHMHALMSYHKRCYESLSENEDDVRQVIEQTRVIKEQADEDHRKLMEKLSEGLSTSTAGIAPASLAAVSSGGGGGGPTGASSSASSSAASTPRSPHGNGGESGASDDNIGSGPRLRVPTAPSAALDAAALAGPNQTSADARQLEMDVERALVATAAGSPVVALKQGFMQKRSTNVVGDWKKRFFVLDTRGTLYYYRSKWGQGISSQTETQDTVSLLTSTVKPVGTDEVGRHFCFKVISPEKTRPFLVQAESEEERQAWLTIIQAVIAGLLNNQDVAMPLLMKDHVRLSFFDSPAPASPIASSRAPSEQGVAAGPGGSSSSLSSSGALTPSGSSRDLASEIGGVVVHEPTLSVCTIAGNDRCVDCSAADPDWASLNLGILMCIECSGVHRRLGVHLSKVRSLTLDVKIWEPSVIALFNAIGNTAANRIFEQGASKHEGGEKPRLDSPLSVKEAYIVKKYSDRLFVDKSEVFNPQMWLWQAVERCKVSEALRAIIIGADVLTPLSEQFFGHISKIQQQSTAAVDKGKNDDAGMNGGVTGELRPQSTVLHRACQLNALGMVEFIIQNCHQSLAAPDGDGNTALHMCMELQNEAVAKLLIRRGSDVAMKNGNGDTPLDIAMSSGKIRDDELLGLLTQTLSSI